MLVSQSGVYSLQHNNIDNNGNANICRVHSVSSQTELKATSYVHFVFRGKWYRVRTDPGKVWKVLEFNVEIFKALKSLENDHRYGKVWKNH